MAEIAAEDWTAYGIITLDGDLDFIDFGSTGYRWTDVNQFERVVLILRNNFFPEVYNDEYWWHTSERFIKPSIRYACVLSMHHGIWNNIIPPTIVKRTNQYLHINIPSVTSCLSLIHLVLQVRISTYWYRRLNRLRIRANIMFSRLITGTSVVFTIVACKYRS